MIASDSAFKKAIYEALCACLSLSPSSTDARAMIREAYNEPENSPRPARTVNVVYWSLIPDDDIADPASYSAVAGEQSGTQKVSVYRPLAYQLQVVCYGSNCEENAHKIRSFIYLDGNGFPRCILRKAGIYPVPGPSKPVFMYESEGSLWRRRMDLSIQLTVRDQAEYPNARGTIQVRPTVIIKR